MTDYCIHLERRGTPSSSLILHCAMALLICFAFPPRTTNSQDVAASSVLSGSGEVAVDSSDIWRRFRPRLSFHHQAGETVGLRQSVTSLNAFVPFSQPSSNWMMFADLKGQFIRDGALGGSTGIGARLHNANTNLTFGSYLYYDYRDTGINDFQQLSPGFEVLAEDWEVRANAYLSSAFTQRKSAPSVFRGNLLFIDRFESAMSGFDAEFGAAIPLLEDIQPRAFAGLYNLQASNRDNIWGWKTRLEAEASNAISLSLAVQNDRMFDTTVNFGVEIRLSGGGLLSRDPVGHVYNTLRSMQTKRTVERRLAASTRRLSTVVVDQTEESLAIDPMTGLPIMLLHVAAGGNSDGSFLDPYQTLTQALDDPRYVSGDIRNIYVRGFQQQIHSGDAVLLPETRLLGNSPVQMLMTDTGIQRLPFSGVNPQLTAPPVIDGQVILSNDTTISGFQINATDGQPTDAGRGVSGTGITNFVIENNVIHFPDVGNGIFLDQASGTGTIHNNRITGNGQNIGTAAIPGSGIILQGSNGLDVDITSNFINDNPGEGLFMTNGHLTADVIDNTINNSRTGIAFESSDSTLSTLNISENRVATNRTGIQIGDGQSDVTISDNIIDRNEFTQIILFSSTPARILGNTITDAFEGQIPPPAELSRIFADPNASVLGGADGTSLGFLGGITLFGSGDVTVSRNEIKNVNFTGILMVGGSPGTVTITENRMTDNVYSGIYLLENNAPPSHIEVSRNTFSGVASAFETSSDFGLPQLGVNMAFNDNVITDSGRGLYLARSHINAEINRNQISNTASPISVFPGDSLGPITGFFEGTIADNVIANSAGTGILVFNISSTIGGIDSTSILRNQVTGSANDGISITSLILPQTGMLIDGNVLNDNGGSGLQVGAKSFTGNITNNTANLNQRSGILIDDPFPVGDDGVIHGNIAGNTTNENQEHGIHMRIVSLNGDLSGNTANDNKLNGIFLDELFADEQTIAGNVADNVASRNKADGIRLNVHSIIGNLERNTTNDNTGFGLHVTASEFIGQVLDNDAMNNGMEGLFVSVSSIAPPPPSILAEDEDNAPPVFPAQNIDFGPFGLDSNPDITDSTTIPHLSILAGGDGTFDYFAFTATAGSRGIFDIDDTGMDSELFLYNGITASLLSSNDDNSGDPGSTGNGVASLIDHVFTSTGPFVIGVGRFDSFNDGGLIAGSAPDVDYTLHVSLENHAFNAPVGPAQMMVAGNLLQGNNLAASGREGVIEHRGAATLDLTLNGNSSSNAVNPGIFNFDLLNTGSGSVTVLPPGVNAANTGTVGSSDGSVVIP